jgi:hypothetical protein
MVLLSITGKKCLPHLMPPQLGQNGLRPRNQYVIRRRRYFIIILENGQLRKLIILMIDAPRTSYDGLPTQGTQRSTKTVEHTLLALGQ